MSVADGAEPAKYDRTRIIGRLIAAVNRPGVGFINCCDRSSASGLLHLHPTGIYAGGRPTLPLECALPGPMSEFDAHSVPIESGPEANDR